MAARTADDARSEAAATRRLALLRNGLLALAVIVGTSPWTTGAYTWVAQRRLRQGAEEARTAAAPAGSATATRTPGERRPRGFDGWEREDAAYWRKLAEGGAFGRLVIPRIGVDVMIVKGVADEDLRRGPGWIPDTSLPGPTGNVGVSGHRTTYLAPFRRIDELAAGDTVTFRSAYRTYTYRVTGRFFAEAHDVGVFAPTPGPTLTLTACHPPYTDRYRIVVRAKLVAVTRDRRR